LRERPDAFTVALRAKADTGQLILFAYRVNATTHLKKSNQTLTVPPGTFKGYMDCSLPR
jgi:hypothetical protein